MKCAQLTTSHHAFQRPYLNGDPASSHNHPRVNNWCVPSFSSLLVSEHAHTHRLQQTYAGGPPCAMKVPPVPRCAPERDVWRANVSRGTCSAAQRHARRSFPGQRWRWRHKQSMSREVRIAVTEVIQHAVEALGCKYRGICLLGQGHSRHYGHLCGRIHESKEIRNTLSCLLLVLRQDHICLLCLKELALLINDLTR